jgi:hypothetical protein
MSFPVLEEQPLKPTIRSYVVLQIKANNREGNKAWMDSLHAGSIGGHRQFMRKYAAERYLCWEKVGWEDNHGPGPSHTWEVSQDLTQGKRFPSKKEALAFWSKSPIADVVVQCVQVTVTARVL